MIHKTASKPKLTSIALLLCLIVSSLFVQVAQAFDKNFFSGNDILFYDPNACTNAVATGNGSLIGNTNEEKIWNFLTGIDGNIPAGDTLTAEQAAGIMGNLRQESGVNFDPNAQQANGAGYGIAQWSFGRRTQLEEAARKKGVPVSDLAFQLQYLYEEAKARPAKGGGGSEWQVIKTKLNVDDALVFWHDSFERSGDSRQAVIETRGGYAHDVFNRLAGKTPATPGNPTSGGSAGDNSQVFVFLDPGHGGAIPQYTDPQSGFVITENPNSPEREDVLDVANRVKADLEKSNYKVVMSRTAPDQPVKFRDRSNAAEAAKADIAVSIHTTPGEINQAWPQRVGTYREYGGKKETFNNAETAKKSESYADIFAGTRTAAEGHTVTTDPGNTTQANSFNRGDIATKGNLSLVQLWAPNVPWVYNEIAQDQGTGISEARKAAYAKGIIDGIKKSLPAKAQGACGGSGATGNLSQTTLSYAWPQYKGLTTAAKPEWTAAANKAKGEGRYIGGIAYPGIDCGGFVTTLLIDSGFEPNYNHGGKLSDGAGATPTQKAWAEKNWKFVGNGNNIKVGGDPQTDDKVLRAGDVAFQPGHTFVYVGTIPGFESTIASASLDERAPMAGRESPTGGNVTWFRKK